MPSKRPSIAELPWLPRLSADFRTNLQAVEQDMQADWGAALRNLATQYLGLNQSISLSRTLRKFRSDRPTKALTRVRLGVVSNATTDFVVPCLEAAALRYGILLEVVTGNFGQAMQEALDPQSAINAFKPDMVLLAMDYRGLPFAAVDEAAWPAHDANNALQQIRAIRRGFRENAGSVCLLQTLPAPAEPVFGSLDAGLPRSLRGAVAKFNELLAAQAVADGDILVDVEWLAQTVGLGEWYDERNWHLARMPFAQEALPVYADFIARSIAAARGKARKCLVLDLDNTLWGGVIGDDGIEGIALNQGDPRGEAHRAIQAAALDLRRRGIVLAVCSKNNEEVARLPFTSHPGMLLKESDIAVFMANWDDKATNLERIAQRLDLGIDALVLLDDNPVERAQVRQALPQVGVPEVGQDPSEFLRSLLWGGYFESAAFTREDLARAEQYQNNAQRAELMETSRNLDDFLRSLNMEIDFDPFHAAGRKRTTQLINKTNQFNVTTRRYTESQVAALEESDAHYTLQVAVRDRFGDNGMICVVICDKHTEDWDIDSWLMSCRVLNRKVEEAVCNRIARDALAAGAKRLIGTYLPTDRNSMVRDLFARLGFQRMNDAEDVQKWILDLERFKPFDVPVAETK